MAKLISQIRLIAGAIALAFVFAMAAPVSAQQINPTASAVKEDQLLKQLKVIQGRVSIPDRTSDVLQQPGGRDWRQFHQVTLRWVGGISILGMLAVLVLFYLKRGMVKMQGGRSGRQVVRFTSFERMVHWMTATCFIILAISGLNLTFGKSLLLPLIGPNAFTTVSELGKYAHNYLSFPFTIGVVAIFLMWIAGNIPNSADVQWVKDGGGLLNDKHPPSHRFNAGQKMIYWIVVIGGIASAVTGYLLMFPFWGGTGIEGMQLAQIIHGVVAVLFVAAMLGHIYIGSIGMEGAFEAMGEGKVDVNWAKQHHNLWLQEEMTKSGSSPSHARTAATPAE